MEEGRERGASRFISPLRLQYLIPTSVDYFQLLLKVMEGFDDLQHNTSTRSGSEGGEGGTHSDCHLSQDLLGNGLIELGIHFFRYLVHAGI